MRRVRFTAIMWPSPQFTLFFIFYKRGLVRGLGGLGGLVRGLVRGLVGIEVEVV